MYTEYDIFPIKCTKRLSSTNDYIHLHESLELLYFSDGSCLVLNGDDFMRAEKGDIIVINSEFLHSVRCEEESATYICLIVDSSFCESMGFSTSNVLFQKKFKNGKISNLLEAIVSEQKSQSPYFKESIKINTLSILLELFKNHIEEKKLDEHRLSNKTEITKNVIKYIKKHFREHITISDIEKHCGYTRHYLSRTFKEVCGVTIMECLNASRMDEAKKMLIRTDLSINTISSQCGFESQSYFGKAFKKFIGCSPMEFRKRKTLDLSH